MPAAERLSDLLTEAEAARQLGISKATLTRERIAGRICFVRMGQRIIRYTPAILSEYINPCRNGSAKSETTGSASGQDRSSGAERGTTPTLGRQDAKALALATFRRRN